MAYFKVTAANLTELDEPPEHAAKWSCDPIEVLLPAETVAELAAENTRDAWATVVHIRPGLIRILPVNSVLHMPLTRHEGYPKLLGNAPLFETIQAASR